MIDQRTRFRQQIKTRDYWARQELIDLINSLYPSIKGRQHAIELASSLLFELDTKGKIKCEYDYNGGVISVRICPKQKMIFTDFPIRQSYIDGVVDTTRLLKLL